ncbi:hypothetical protein DFR42_106219 [Undibacterium pigrum]|uniref:Uncharacterized protein n=1 Tax=Undibacterium pigrum TaxID=401470 RepID=A0A318J2V1_9BURK|nr:hypothetical protein DFR42_106219 [Undibacterium pigrum]
MDNFQGVFVCEGLILGCNKDVIEFLLACDNNLIVVHRHDVFSNASPENFNPIKQIVNLTIDLVSCFFLSKKQFLFFCLFNSQIQSENVNNYAYLSIFFTKI